MSEITPCEESSENRARAGLPNLSHPPGDAPPVASDGRSHDRTWGDWLEGLFHRFHPGAIPTSNGDDEEFKKADELHNGPDAYQRAAWEEEAELLYAKDLEKSLAEDLSDVDNYGFLSLPCKDAAGRAIVLVVARNLPANIMDPQRIYRYIITKLDSVVDEPYSVVYVHTNSSYWENSPGTLWLRSAYERLPVKYKRNLHKFHVLHSDMSLWLSMSVVCRFMSHGFWGRVQFVPRVEFLWDSIGQKNVMSFLPKFVQDHDKILEEEPLHDYGYVNTTKDMPLPGAPM